MHRPVTGPGRELAPRLARQRAMPAHRWRLTALALPVVLAVALAACASGSSPSPSGSPAGPSPSFAPSSSPSPSASAGSPSPSVARSPSPSMAASPGAVETAEEAVALVLAQDPRFAHVGPFDIDMIGQSAWYTVDPASDGWTVVITIGWGDCPSGCIEKHIWTYTVTTGGTVTLMAEAGPSVPSDAVPAG